MPISLSLFALVLLLPLQAHAISNDDNSCGLYFAKSTIPNAGVGIFTTKPLKEGNSVGNDEIAIPYIDFPSLDILDYAQPFSEYAWDGLDLGMSQEHPFDDELSAFCPGFDAAINCNMALLNTHISSEYVDDASLHRSRDVGAGAISLYQMKATKVIHDVPAGGELFKSYGDEWFTVRGEQYSHVPLPGHYETAQELCDKVVDMNISLAIKTELWEVVKSLQMDARSLNALPDTFDKVEQAARDGIRSLHQPSAIRTVQELQATGRCIDNIRPGKSTIPGAGRGAFATRNLKEGQIITASPLLNLVSGELVEMLDLNTHEPVGLQIIINYCFGHAQSTLLLCPYGVGIGYMNHNSNNATNVKIQWTPDGTLNHRDAKFNQNVSDLSHSASLSFDYVATRDIQEGEELFLDYGSEWQEAWQTHVRNWRPPQGSESYVSAKQFNNQMKHGLLATKEELQERPLPSNLEQRCHSQLANEEILIWENWELGIKCEILDRTVDGNGTDMYQVEFLDDLEDQWEYTRSFGNVPRVAIKVFDKMRSTDHHLQDAFRHELMIPDEIFPPQWKNLK